jgi:hypothetical protein
MEMKSFGQEDEKDLQLKSHWKKGGDKFIAA